MNVENSLICKIVETKEIHPVAEAGVTPAFFLDQISRQVYDYIVKHNANYGKVPGVSVIKSEFPEYKLTRIEEPLQFWIDAIRDNHSLSLLEQGISASAEAYDNRDTRTAMEALSRTLAAISTAIPNTRDVNVVETGMERFAKYLALKDMPNGLRGIPTGFSAIDRATQGMQKEQLIVFVGPPKAGKSTIMLLAAIAAWLQGELPLFFTFEMSTDEMLERMDAIRAGVSHARLRNGTLKPSEWEKLERYIKQVEEMPDFWFSSDSFSATTLSGIRAKIDQHKPTIVFVDGVYMMDDENGEAKGSPQALTNITRGFKRLAQNAELPLAISTQVLTWKMSKRRGITADSIGYSSSFAQDADTIIGIEKTDDPDINKLRVVLARNCPPLEVYCKWDWNDGTFDELEGEPDDDSTAF